MHPIQKYCADRGIGVDDFAALCGCTKSTIYKIVKGTRNAGPDLVRTIARVTDGEVTANDLFGALDAAE